MFATEQTQYLSRYLVFFFKFERNPSKTIEDIDNNCKISGFHPKMVAMVTDFKAKYSTALPYPIPYNLIPLWDKSIKTMENIDNNYKNLGVNPKMVAMETGFSTKNSL